MRIAVAVVFVALLTTAIALWTWPSAAQEGNSARDPVARDLSAYRLRVGDQVDVVVYEHAELSRGSVVPGNGEISFLPIGKLKLLDKTVFEVEAEIAQRLRAENFLASPRVSCIVTAYSPRIVYLLGAVQGTVQLPTHKNVRILELLAMAGGLSNPSADFSRVTVRRYRQDGQAYPIPVSVSDILERNDESKNIVIREGDMVIVSQLEGATPNSADWVYVLGKVGSPGRHPLLRSRDGFFLTQLIAMTGDFQEFANRNEVVLIRKTETGRTRQEIDFDAIISNDHPDVELMPNDLIYVKETFF